VANPLDLVHLRSLVAIADTGGFGRAAATLHLSQSTVSQHVRLLEKRVGKPLVARQGRATRFTQPGEQLIAEARRILAVHDEALERLAGTERPTLVIGSTETAAEQVLPRVLGDLRDAFPEWQVQFHIDRSTQMVEAVRGGSIDFAVILAFADDAPGRSVGELPLGWYATEEWLARRDVTVPLVAYVEPCGMRQRALARLADAHTTAEVVAESTSLEGVLAAARAGIGVAVLPSEGKAPSGLVPVEGLPALGTIGVHVAARRGLEPAVESRAVEVLSRRFAAA